MKKNSPHPTSSKYKARSITPQQIRPDLNDYLRPQRMKLE